MGGEQGSNGGQNNLPVCPAGRCGRIAQGDTAMKAISLLLLRVSTGLLLPIWAIVRLAATDQAIGVSDKYYFGLVSNEAMQIGLGIVQLALGLAVIAGLFRRIAYPLQAVWLGLGALFVWTSIVDPLGIVFGQDNVNILFFPSLTVFVATLVLIAFRDEDTASLDARREAGPR